MTASNNYNFRIETFEEQYFDSIKDLVRTGWNPNHVLLKSDVLFRWHYRGFGKNAGIRFPIVFDGDKIIGYRMMTPIELIFSDINGNHTIIPLSASSLYYVDSNYRGMKLGVMLEQHVINYYGGYFTIAANPVTAVPILKRSGCKMIDQMLRYFRPLSNDISPIFIGEHYPQWNLIDSDKFIEPCSITAEELSTIWTKSIDGVRLTALNRSKDFWQWRYLDDPIYKYFFFKNQFGVIVARICSIFNEHYEKTAYKVLRILEIIPTEQNVWSGSRSEGLSALIDGVCGWGKAQGCLAAEFYTTSSRLDMVMNMACFEEINTNNYLSTRILSYFEPASNSHRLTNVGILSSLLPEDFDYENSYFTLSDADQDRPNII